MNDKIEMLTREVERWAIVVGLQDKIAKCDETEYSGSCDVCVGLRYAIEFVKSRMENE